MANQTILRISKEIRQVQQGNDLSIAVAYQEEDVRNLRAVILGPSSTPYEYGFFEFSIKFGSDYPSKPPKVDAKTTNNGRCRFNPNIYAGGKVCLSILGTWHGEMPGEEWSSVQGLESILWSIQSLMSNNPYENEPGFENAKNESDVRLNEAYCAKIRHETIRIAVIQKLEAMFGIKSDGSVEVTKEGPKWTSSDDEDEGDDDNSEDKVVFEPFNDLQKRRFLWYYESYLTTIEKYASKHKDGEAFEIMPFEGGSNQMQGKFHYCQLGKRLVRLKEAINEETLKWAEEGLIAKQRESTIAYTMQSQFNQFVSAQKTGGVLNIDIELEDGNPFVWIMTYFGKPESNLDGGMFKIRISLSPRFPDEQPRVKVVTSMYHHRVSPDGTLCYFVKKPEEMQNHIQTIVQALEEQSPPYDPRTIVNPEASRLLWGSAEDKKKYGRFQRRAAQRSLEEDT